MPPSTPTLVPPAWRSAERSPSDDAVSSTFPPPPLALTSSSPLPPAAILLPTSRSTISPPPPCLRAALLAAAIAHLGTQALVYGPLWSVRCSTKTRPRIELQVYDVFAMVFLNRPGAYYRLDQRARMTRGAITPQLIITQLRTYHQLMANVHDDGTKASLTNNQLKDWWLVPPAARTALDLQLVAHPPTPPYDYSYIPFLRSFIPQNRDRDIEHRFFNSLSRYIAVFLSTDVELRLSPALS